ncbi:MAG: NAD(P)-dependent glycerol-3-phosphate dehydrogenase [candidate division KSB1 bacterium]|nr:NAD(P)-dependent glycerol-3-phosphate dehydrogenase [candidate division KSB1 bacterium]
MATRFTILGGGSWGTALAILLHSAGYSVSILELQTERAEELRQTRENRIGLPGVHIPEAVVITDQPDLALRGCQWLVVALPSHVVRQALRRIADLPLDWDRITVVSGTKGLEVDTFARMSEVIEEELPISPQQIAVLSGPSHAEEVSRGIPTAVVAASRSEEVARKTQRAFMTPRFRVYASQDVIGVELGGALKNVVAIAAGICDGLGFGDNTKAALQPRGLVEMVRLGKALGADPMTFAGLSGMGDLIVTCMSRHSRNRRFGEYIGQGLSFDDALRRMTMVAEGVRTARAAFQLSQRLGVDMPITAEVYRILYEGKKPLDALFDLMTRHPKMETWG